MRLAIEHRTTYAYEPEPQDLALRLRLYAGPSAQQQVESWAVEVNGEAVAPLLTAASGEREGLWFQRKRGAEVEVVAKGVVSTSDAAGVLGKEPRLRAGVYRRTTRLTKPDEAIRAIGAKAEGENMLARLHALNALVHAAMDYRPGVTDSTTTAAQAAALGAGVCQDYAHVFIAAARGLGVPARYVVGYIHDAETPEPETHAWAEAYVDGLGWVGFDPVHDLCPAERHVRLITGFDAADAAPIRGTMVRGSEEKMDVAVRIAEESGQAQSQTQK